MKAYSTSIRALLYAVLLSLAFFSLPSLAGEKALSISSLSADERNKLPDSTQVTLPSGKTVTLGILRTEHRARMERFAKAAELGKSAAGTLKPHRATAIQKNSVNIGGGGSTPLAPGKPVIPKTGPERPQVPSLPSLVPFKMPTFLVTLAKDYVDFCTAARPSACLYMPANANIYAYSAPHLSVDTDWLITDRATCEFDGGHALGPPHGSMDACNFYYPMDMKTPFTPTGPLDTKVACDPPAKYIVDDKGAVQVSYAGPTDSRGFFSTGSSPVTCVVQVWIESK